MHSRAARSRSKYRGLRTAGSAGSTIEAVSFGTPLPRSPPATGHYPSTPEVFRDVSGKGEQLRRLHLMEEEVFGDTRYPCSGDGYTVVGKVSYEDDAVFINEAQCFKSVPELAWNLYIVGYQPAQKWLKDRKGRTLGYEDIVHYHRIIKLLSETDRIMRTIDMPL